MNCDTCRPKRKWAASSSLKEWFFLFKIKHFKALPRQISSSPTSNFLLALRLLLLTSEAVARSLFSPPGFFFIYFLCNSILKSHSTHRMPDVVSTSEPSPESAGACVVTGKSFEVRPQKICADRDTDEKHQAYIQPSWRLYLKQNKKKSRETVP